MINNKEYILCAAIHYDNKIEYPFMRQTYGIKSGFVLCGYRHSDIIRILPTNRLYPNFNSSKLPLNKDLIWEKIDENTDNSEINSEEQIVQGFITSKGRFVDRKEASQIAYAAKQILEPKNLLYSEDIY